MLSEQSIKPHNAMLLTEMSLCCLRRERERGRKEGEREGRREGGREEGREEEKKEKKKEFCLLLCLQAPPFLDPPHQL
jgi:hypothetical protein